jgi:hypothetical protein
MLVRQHFHSHTCRDGSGLRWCRRRGVSGLLGGAEDVKLSRTRCVLGCRNERGKDRVPITDEYLEAARCHSSAVFVALERVARVFQKPAKRGRAWRILYRAWSCGQFAPQLHKNSILGGLRAAMHGYRSLSLLEALDTTIG